VFARRGPIAVEAHGLYIPRRDRRDGVPTTPIGFDWNGAKVDEPDGHAAAAC
jgi:hypothetical protein